MSIAILSISTVVNLPDTELDLALWLESKRQRCVPPTPCFPCFRHRCKFYWVRGGYTCPPFSEKLSQISVVFRLWTLHSPNTELDVLSWNPEDKDVSHWLPSSVLGIDVTFVGYGVGYAPHSIFWENGSDTNHVLHSNSKWCTGVESGHHRCCLWPPVRFGHSLDVIFVKYGSH